MLMMQIKSRVQLEALVGRPASHRFFGMSWFAFEIVDEALVAYLVFITVVSSACLHPTCYYYMPQKSSTKPQPHFPDK